MDTGENRTPEKRIEMMKLVKPALVAAVALSLVAGGSVVANAHTAVWTCPTAAVPAPTTPVEYAAATTAYTAYTATTEAQYNSEVAAANEAEKTEVKEEVAADAAAKKKLNVALKAAKVTLKASKAKLEAAQDALLLDPTNTEKQYLVTTLLAVVVADRAAVKAEKDLVKAKREAASKRQDAVKKATEKRSKHLRECAAPKKPKGKKKD